MRVPEGVRADLRRKVGALAERAGWTALRASDRSRLYQEWADDPTIGGTLQRYLSLNQIRTYIKDTLIKPYARGKLHRSEDVLALLGLDAALAARERYARPPGVRLEDGRVICWSRAEDWKQLLMAVFERSYSRPTAKPHAAVLLAAVGRHEQEPFRKLVEAAGAKLGIANIVWRT